MTKIYQVKYEATRLKEKIDRRIAWLLPRSIVMWAFIRVVSHATTGKWSNQIVSDLSAMDALERWDEPQ